MKCSVRHANNRPGEFVLPAPSSEASNLCGLSQLSFLFLTSLVMYTWERESGRKIKDKDKIVPAPLHKTLIGEWYHTEIL